MCRKCAASVPQVCRKQNNTRKQKKTKSKTKQPQNRHPATHKTQIRAQHGMAPTTKNKCKSAHTHGNPHRNCKSNQNTIHPHNTKRNNPTAKHANCTRKTAHRTKTHARTPKRVLNKMPQNWKPWQGRPGMETSVYPSQIFNESQSEENNKELKRS